MVHSILIDSFQNLDIVVVFRPGTWGVLVAAIPVPSDGADADEQYENGGKGSTLMAGYSLHTSIQCIDNNESK